MMPAFKTENEFIQFAATELLISPFLLDSHTVFRNLQTWSSLNALIFVSRISEETGVLISSEDLAGMKTLSEIYQLIILRGNGAL